MTLFFRKFIANYIGYDEIITSCKVVSDSPDSAFYDQNGKAVKALDPNWKQYCGEMSEDSEEVDPD